MTEDAELFDRTLLRKRRGRFAGEMAEHGMHVTTLAQTGSDRTCWRLVCGQRLVLAQLPCSWLTPRGEPGARSITSPDPGGRGRG